MKKLHFLLFIIFFFIISFSVYNLFFNKETVYIAVVGPVSGSSKNNGQSMIKGIELCIENANKSGINKKKFKLLVYDDINNKENAVKIASQIAKEDKALLVLGHYYSTTSLAAGEIYNNAQIPAITASATANDIVKGKKWYFRTISNNSIQGAFIAYYIHKVFKNDVVNIIYDDDSYGMDLVSCFESTAHNLGIKTRKWGFNIKEFDNKLDDIITELRETDISGTVFVATHSPEGAKIVSLLKYPGAKYTIIGPDSFCSESFIETLKSESNQEIAHPGYHSDGIYVISPFIIDIANQKAQKFRKDYIEKYHEEPTWINAYYYDAMLAAIYALNKPDINVSNDLKSSRKQLRENLASLNSFKNAINGVTGPIHFDKHGENAQPFAVGIYNDQKITSAFVQYHSFSDVDNVTEILKAILKGDIIKINNMYMCQTRVVFTGIDINDVILLNLKEQTYTIDFYLWFRYQKDFKKASHIRFVNTVGSFYIDEKLSAKNIYPISRIFYKKEKDYITEAFHITAKFRNIFDFHKYPFESHDLIIKYRHNNLVRDKLIYVSDILGMSHFKHPLTKTLKKYTALNAWHVLSTMFYQNVITNDSTLGYPGYFKSQNRVEYSEFNTEVKIKRNIFSFLIKNVFLIIVLLIILYFIYFIPIDQLSIKITIGMSTLLTTAFSHIKLGNRIPVGYVLTIEHAFFGIYGISALSILLSIWLYKLYYHTLSLNNDAEVHNINKKIQKIKLIGMIAHPIIVLVVVLFLTCNT